ncbi:polysaccharide export outer membrane protein [Neorhizobium galegae]|uniref:polysaccharide biosynthesis/export family protein n=1 Tax=Neorhizobium galegae TaxID=399 RepID=UPI001ED08897|nr:polysaccharide biosynthesis/export family protein [Neorhizobium galegae]MBP2561342.1 polysaccharide export outer membrane protein [Neorhizobium galegae]
MAIWFAAFFPGMPARAADYTLGPQDVLKIRVFEWRPNAGVAFEWVPLTGEFAVSAAGTLSLPIIGTVSVAGKTLDDVSSLIGEQLQRQVGLQKRPNASVEVSVYRPFFVTGLVSKPGKYGYVPGLTVIQAISMAGGLGGADPEMIGLQRDALVTQGDLGQLEIEHYGLLARQARVEALLGGAATVSFSQELTSQATRPALARMMQDEQALFETRLHLMNTELDRLGQAKILATNQLETLRLKEVSLARQTEMATKDLTSINKMVSQGLTVSSRQLGANQGLADLESRSLDVSLAILKTQQDLAKLDQEMGDFRQKYRGDALAEAVDLRDRLAANSEKAKTARALLANIELRAPAVLAALESDGKPAFMTMVNRTINGAMQTLVVSDNDEVAPGDVVRVERRVKDIRPKNF